MQPRPKAWYGCSTKHPCHFRQREDHASPISLQKTRLPVPLRLLFSKTEYSPLKIKADLPESEPGHAHYSTEIPAAGLLP
jgi:hypothetical protein